MTNRERVNAVLHYQPYDHMPVVHFGYWVETLERWEIEGYIEPGLARRWSDGNDADKIISEKLGFDFNWQPTCAGNSALFPAFEVEVVKDLGGGVRHVRNAEGVTIIESDSAEGIPMEIDHLLVDRTSWEKYYLPKLQYTADRVDIEAMRKYVDTTGRDIPVSLHCGSLFGDIRNWTGLEGISYLYADDEELYDEIITVKAELTYKVVKAILETGAKFDYAHFWEDICFKNGPLVTPSVFEEKVGPWYRKITDLVRAHGCDIISLDCDGCIDALLPIWLANGVNTMFPIEVGTWNASIAPWREKYGKELRGVGGMNKTVFAQDYAAIDREIERLKPLIALGGYIPCPDHRIAPDAKWENVQYYCDRMHQL